jgi:hypothetical protein
MSFSSVQSQQFGSVMNYSISGSKSATIGEVIFSNTGEGSFIYSLTLIVTIASSTTFGTTDIKIGTNINTASEKIINVMKNDVTGKTEYTYNMSGVAVDDFDIYLYASSHTSPYTQNVTWIGSVQLIKVV